MVLIQKLKNIGIWNEYSGGNWSCHLHISYYHNSKITANTLDDIYRQLAESNNGRLEYLRNPLNYKGEKDKNVRI